MEIINGNTPLHNVLQECGTLIESSGGDEYYYLPVWFKLINDGKYSNLEVLHFEHLPKELSAHLLSERQGLIDIN